MEEQKKTSKTKSVFEVLNAVDCSAHIEKKNGLNYLSWAWAWGMLKTYYPEAKCNVYEDSRGLNYFTDGKTAYVKVGISINGEEQVEYLPVMDYRNKSIAIDKMTSFDVNTAVQRCKTKCIALWGLGLNIYAGEDIEALDDTGKEEEPKAYKKCDIDRYMKYIQNEAEGLTYKDKPYKYWWMVETNADAEAIAKFDADVKRWKENNAEGSNIGNLTTLKP